ncbi:EcsC family protein [Acinetobacter soli]|uniref:EcsC family protein n=1 Tax=Acinetobacter soli TaxID=487316 RepID=UPI000CE325A8|nr:EcsC family protein [Acinetobacter soli]PPB86595.1 EcsC family protein [Acinetobacter soli]WEI13437.1 EcsC family protein [Acinetobacter soli]WEI15117.1 EcsC family protein [Acinetobacter soli]
MTNSNNNQSQSLLSAAFGVAKKLSSSGLDVLNHVAPGTISKMNSNVDQSRTVEGKSQIKGAFEIEKYDNPQQMLRQHLPKVSHQLLGRHYGRVYSVANFLSPDFQDKIADYLFDRLNDFTAQTSSLERVLEEAGVKRIEDLTTNPDRSQRLSHAFIEQNKLIAIAQGAFSGATGVAGAALDVPLSLLLALRTIYQTGHAHGFNLSDSTQQDIVEFVFKEIDLSLIAEKQTLLLALKTLKSMLQTHDISQFQQLLGSSNDAEAIKKWFVDETGEPKFSWLNGVSRFSAIGKLTPVAGAALGGIYSWKLIEDAGNKAQAIFGGARHYLLEHPDEQLTPLQAYHAEASLFKAVPLKEPQAAQQNTEETKIAAETEQVSVENPVVAKVKVTRKASKAAQTEAEIDDAVQQKIEHLADHYVEPHEESEPQQPALKTTEVEEGTEVAAFDETQAAPAKPKRKRTPKPKTP